MIGPSSTSSSSSNWQASNFSVSGPSSNASALIKSTEKIVEIHLIDNFYHLSSYYSEKLCNADRVINSKKQLPLKILSNHTIRFTKLCLDKLSLFKAIQPTISRPFHRGLHLKSLFFLFLEDCLSLFSAYQTSSDRSSQDASEYRIAILSGFARYRYAATNVTIRKDFISVCNTFYQELQKLLPIGDKLLEEFNHWIALFDSHIDFIELYPNDFFTLENDKEKMSISSITERYNRYMRDQSTPLDSSLLTLSFMEACEGTSQLPDMISLLLQAFQNKALLLLKDYDHSAIGMNWKIGDDPIIQEANGCQQQMDYFIYNSSNGWPSKFLFYSLNPPDKLIEILNESMMSALSDIKRRDFFSAQKTIQKLTPCNSNRETWPPFPGFLDIISEIELQSKQGWRIFDKVCKSDKPFAIRAANQRLNAYKICQEIHEILDTIQGILNDLCRYDEAIKTPKSKPQNINDSEESAAPPSKGSSVAPKRKTNSKKKAKKKVSPSTPAIEAAVSQKSLEKKEEEAYSSPITPVNAMLDYATPPKREEPELSLSVTPARIWMSGGWKAAQRKLWRSLAEGLQGFLPYLQSNQLQHTLKRLSVTVLHSLLEQALSERIAPIDTNALSHNLWVLQNRVENARKSAILKELHLGIHWSRYTCEWDLEWQSRSTLRHTPKILTFLSESFSKSGLETIKRLQKEALAYHDTLFGLDDGELLPFHQHPSIQIGDGILNDGKNAIEKIEEKIVGLPIKDTWIKQWSLDLSDLRATLSLLEKTDRAQEFLLLFSHALSLLHGTVQSPLYHLQKVKRGSHSTRHDLLALFNELEIELSASQRYLLTREIKGLSTIHRYPFKQEITSTVHHLFLEAILWYLEPFDDKAFLNREEESVFDAALGKPLLNQIRHPKELCILLSSLVTQTMNELVESLYQEVIRKLPNN